MGGGRETQGPTEGEIGILLVNLGTPDEPKPRAVRRYLREFLSDPRVVDLPRPIWWLILNLFVLPRRPRYSAALYRKIWHAGERSPLLRNSERIAAALEESLRRRLASVRVKLAMRYGRPSIADGLYQLRHTPRILLLPLFPQYSSATTGSICERVFVELGRLRAIPEVRTVLTYHDESAYVRSLAASIREIWERGDPPDRLIFSFHGIPRRYAEAGDPYVEQCRGTARAVAQELALPSDRWLTSFQSRFGREEWMKPYTDVVLNELLRDGVHSVDVVCPGFAADCLETLEEIDMRTREAFMSAGGKQFRYIPALNDRADHVDALATIAMRNLRGWAECDPGGR